MQCNTMYITQYSVCITGVTGGIYLSQDHTEDSLKQH